MTDECAHAVYTAITVPWHDGAWHFEVRCDECERTGLVSAPDDGEDGIDWDSDGSVRGE